MLSAAVSMETILRKRSSGVEALCGTPHTHLLVLSDVFTLSRTSRNHFYHFTLPIPLSPPLSFSLSVGCLFFVFFFFDSVAE